MFCRYVIVDMFCRYVSNPVETLAKYFKEKPVELPEVVKGKIIAGDPAELNVLTQAARGFL